MNHKNRYYSLIVDDNEKISDNQVVKRRRTEDEIQSLIHALKFSPTTIVITDEKGRIEYVNPKFTQLTGYSIEEATGENPRILKSGETSPEVYKELWETITAGNEWRGEFLNRKKNGELYWESASVSAVKNDEGIISKFVAVKEDITERKRSEKRLKAQYEVTKVLAESNTIEEVSPGILQAVCMALEWEVGEIWAFDQQKEVLYNTGVWHEPSLKIPEFKAVTKQINFPQQIGLPGRVWESAGPVWIADVVHDTNFLRASVADKEGLHGAFGFPIIDDSKVLGTFCFFSREIRDPDNDLLDMMMALGRQIGLFIKRRQAEEALLQSEKLTSMGTITAGISHEFNNILAVIMGSAEVLERDCKDDQELKKGLKAIIKASGKGAEIARSMLKFTRTDKGTTGFALHDINDLLKQALYFTMPRWKNTAHAKGINYDMDTEGIETVSSILCNPSEIKEVFANMINNSLDAMPDGGCMSFSTWVNKGTVLIRISDNGEGMPEGVKRKILDPFFTTKGVGWAGLGLSTAYGIINRHGGKIEWESEVGKGSTFTLHFPMPSKAYSAGEIPDKGISDPEQKLQGKELRILVVDDEKAICNILDKFLSREGHMVRTVNNGTEAIILTKVIDYDLVLCDIAMPEVSGHDVIKAMNKLRKRPKIGMLTGWNEKIESRKEECKVDFILTKPFNLSELARHINDLGIT